MSSSDDESSKGVVFALRRFEAFRSMRVHTQRARQAKAESIEKKKRMPPILMKLCPSTIDPNEDCFAMTLDVSPKFGSSGVIPCPPPPPYLPTDMPTPRNPSFFDPMLCLNIRSDDFSEALVFYIEAFGAEDQSDSTEAILKIGAQKFVIFSTLHNYLTPDGALFSLSTDDVDSVVDKALMEGATLLGKPVQVYSKCQKMLLQKEIPIRVRGALTNKSQKALPSKSLKRGAYILTSNKDLSSQTYRATQEFLDVPNIRYA
uniref:Uncharacterized protein n=1 Tax=Daucus carota subsp. sativus TaxID=79200 RepID=A0A164SLN3_DAUCS